MVADRFEVIQYLNSAGISFKEQGNELILQSCPYCEANKKGNYKHFYFNQDKQTFYCHKCGEKGNLYKFKIDRGDLEPLTKFRKIAYKRPDNPDQYKRKETTFLDWYNKERGIAQQTVSKYEIGYLKRECDGVQKDFIVYHYYNEKKELINRKFRSLDKKNMWTEKDAEKIYYGLQFVDFEHDELIICEGEDDCHALDQEGFKNVVSVPYGAGTYTPQMDEINKRFNKLILIFDNDDRGQQGAKQFAEKAGLIKCWNTILPFKDPRDCLAHGLDFFTISAEIKKAKQFTHPEIVKTGDHKKEFVDFLFNSKKLIGMMTPSVEFNRILGGIRLSELTVVTGQTGTGKTTFADNVASWVERCGMNVLLMHFENKFVSIIRKMIEIYSGQVVYGEDEETGECKICQSKEWVEEWVEKLNDSNLYFLNKAVSAENGYFTIEHLEKIVEYAVKFYNINFIVIDHLHYFLKISDAKRPDLKIDETVRTIKQWTDKYNIHIFLLVHPHMTQDDKHGNSAKLGLNSPKGASSIVQETDNFIVVARGETENGSDTMTSEIDVKKNREHGRRGKFMLQVLPNRNSMMPVKAVKIEKENETYHDNW